MIYLINQGMRKPAGWRRGCVGVGVRVEVAKLAALPSQQSVGEVSLNRAIIVGEFCKVWRARKKRGRWVLLCRAPFNQ